MASPEGRSRRGDRTTGGQSSFIRGAPTRVAPSTSLSRRDDDVSEARSDVSSARTAREPMRREAWSANGVNDEDLDEWDYAERGPLAKLKTRQMTEVAREKATMGVYVDDAELGAYSDAVPAHLKKLTADPDFIGPESYPRRQRDWVGYYVAFVMCFASFVIGVAAISNGKPEYLFRLVESASGRLCGADAGVTNEPFLWHPHAGERDHGLGAELSVCVKACPTAHDWVCVDADVANAFKAQGASAATNATDVVYNASVHGSTAPPPSPPPMPPSSACPSGVYLHSLMDFEPVFHACLPKDKEKQTVRGAATTGEAGEGSPENAGEEGEGSAEGSEGSTQGSEGSTSPPRDKHFESALREVDTPERFIANAVFAEVDANRWPLVLTLVLVIGLAFGLNAILNRDAANYHAVSLAGSILLGAFITALFGLKPFFKMDTVSGVLIDDLDDRLSAARFVRAATPYLAVPAALLVVRVASHAVRNRDRLGLGTTLLDVAGSVLSLAGLDVVIPLAAIGPLISIAFWVMFGTIYLSAVASRHFHDDRVARGGGLERYEGSSGTDLEGTSNAYTDSAHTDSAGWHGVYRGATAFHFLFCGWCATWVVLFVRCVVSTVVVSWYWAREGDREKRLAEMSTWRAFRRVALCHAGSLALLAFWMPALIAPRIAVGAYCKIRGLVGTKTPPYSVPLAYRSAAVCQIALHGCSLRRACFNQHHLKMRNREIVRKCERAADGVMFAGWVCVALASFAICAGLTGVDFLTIRAVRWTLAPASCAALAGTVVFFAFFMAHREAVETIIQCFCEDTERNNGTPLRQYYAPAALKKLIFVDVQGHRAPSDRDADDAFEAEFKEQRRAKKEARRERKSNSSRMGSVNEEA